MSERVQLTLDIDARPAIPCGWCGRPFDDGCLTLVATESKWHRERTLRHLCDDCISWGGPEKAPTTRRTT